MSAITNRHARAGKLGAARKWGQTVDRAVATEAARRAAEDRWVREVRAEHPDLNDRTVEQMAEHRRREYFLRLFGLGCRYPASTAPVMTRLAAKRGRRSSW